jgi:signal transduction histidine kinase
VRIGTRITVATALSVTLMLTTYAALEVRARGDYRQIAIENEARATALILRTTLETLGADIAHVDPIRLTRDLSRDMARSNAGWRVVLAPIDVPGAPPIERPALTPAQTRRLAALAGSPQLALLERDGSELALALPLRAQGERGVEVTGMLEVSRSVAKLDADFSHDVWRAIGWVVVISALATTAVFLLTQSLMTRPMAKLLAGVDEVARGDLSHVLLSERDDEIGVIASRFNDMTFSLRESRAETRRSSDAKLTLEQRMAHTEKLATIGQIAAEIAHEVGTPLNVIAGRARATQKRANDPEAVDKNATIIAEQTARITRIIQRLLDFARRRVGSTGMTRINLNEVTLVTMELLASQFTAAKVKTRLIRAEGLPAVMADSDRVQQVLLNLLINAIQAMPDGGAVTVETSTVIRQRPGLELDPEHAFVRFEVSDTGNGIAADRRDKIFEPFYTSKDGQGGTGLGLAVCAGIVKEHDGWIEVDEAGTGGAVFRVFLPAAASVTSRPRTDARPDS